MLVLAILAVFVAGCVQTVRSVARSVQPAMPFGLPVFEVLPLCRATEPRASVIPVAWARAREIVHTFGDAQVRVRARGRLLWTDLYKLVNAVRKWTTRCLL